MLRNQQGRFRERGDMATVSNRISSGAANLGNGEATEHAKVRNNHGDMMLNRISSSQNEPSVFITQPHERRQISRDRESGEHKNTGHKNGGKSIDSMEISVKGFDPREVRDGEHFRESDDVREDVRQFEEDGDDPIDYKAIKKEAKTEFKRLKENATKKYERRLGEARGEFLRSAVSSQEKYRTEMRDARDEMDEIVVQAREQYEFTLDMVRDLNDVSKEDLSSLRSK